MRAGLTRTAPDCPPSPWRRAYKCRGLPIGMQFGMRFGRGDPLLLLQLAAQPEAELRRSDRRFAPQTHGWQGFPRIKQSFSLGGLKC